MRISGASRGDLIRRLRQDKRRRRRRLWEFGDDGEALKHVVIVIGSIVHFTT